MKVLNVFYSVSGNTKKIALQIEKTVKAQGHEVDTIEVTKNTDKDTIDFLKYDFVFVGTGVYVWLPPQDVVDLWKNIQMKYVKSGDIKVYAPRRANKKAVTYCTFAGPHTGRNEAIPVPKYLGQLLDHLGFEVITEWFFEGQFNNKDSFYDQFNTKGRMGNIIGRPNEDDLKRVDSMVSGILHV
ncbi:flavodoxin domain-containing protein [Clostridiaceae bacterium M8S5]|nr:flavodoxin domain-containing protein [Clostridiaceae bacterium M8S5]